MGVSLTPNPVRHPRRFGFIIFNVICVVLLVLTTSKPTDQARRTAVL